MNDKLTFNLNPASAPADTGVQQEKLVIIGSGPAGLTAALYTARANLNPVVIAGHVLGGQVSLTYEIENYPGFPEGLSGQELVDKMVEQAQKFGARLVMYTAVSEVDFTHGSPFTIKTDDGKQYEAEAVIVTAGANPRRLNIPGEAQYTGNGVSYCATCDGFFFRGKNVVVVGGGDSALEEALFLTKFANRVDIIHRRDQLRAGATLQTRAQANDKIHFIWNTVIEEIVGEQNVKSVRLRNVETGETSDYPTDGVFIFIGHDPNSDLFQGQLARDQFGYLITDKEMHTNIEGVFAAGEVQDRIFRQVATSVGQGTAAAISCERWLAAHETPVEQLQSTAS
ncbi:MAG TPA: thioredoxin-disulfide reductase [Aggregatilineaceae bacterium]|nr:thioredoxin-disulfide reductase [Aggregatilineaceae bacterium]